MAMAAARRATALLATGGKDNDYGDSTTGYDDNDDGNGRRR
jgi:hypothetical protein